MVLVHSTGNARRIHGECLLFQEGRLDPMYELYSLHSGTTWGESIGRKVLLDMSVSAELSHATRDTLSLVSEDHRPRETLTSKVTHISLARSYPYDSLLHVNYQVLATNGMSRAELLKGGLHTGTVCAFCLSTKRDLTLDRSICSKNISSPFEQKHSVIWGRHARTADCV